MRLKIIFVIIFSIAIMFGCAPKEAVKPEEPKPAPAPQPQAEEPTPVPSQVIPQPEIKLESVYFDFDKSNIRGDASQVLQNNATLLKNAQGIKVRIEGNCDERGTNDYNMALGERRANSARDYLVNLGVDKNLLITVSYGEEKPICTEQNEACWSKNRRVDFIVEK